MNEEPESAKNVMLIFAHPDDETFTCGGTILKKVRAGSSIKLICATRGDAGELGNPPVCTREELSEVREKEVRDASSILGISYIYFFDYLDGKLNEVPIDELSEKIFEIIEKEKPDEIFTFGPDGITNHPDHIAISRATDKAFEKLNSKTCSLFFVSILKKNIEKLRKTEGDYNALGEISMKVDITHELDKKIEALKCHKTQNKDVERFLENSKVIDLNFEYFQKVN